MKNRKALSTFIFTLLLSTCLLIKTDNTNSFTTQELFYNASNYGISNFVAISMISCIRSFKAYKNNNWLLPLEDKNKWPYPLLTYAAQTIIMEGMNYIDPTYKKKLGKKRFISSTISFVGTIFGNTIFNSEIIGLILGPILGTTSDILLNKQFPPKNSPLDPSTLKKNTDELQQFINSKQSNNFSNNSKSN